MAGFPELALQWSKLIAGCAEEGKDADLVVAGTLIAAIAALQTCDFNEARQLANRAAAHASEIGLDSLGVRASALYGYLGVLEREADTPSNTPQSEAILSVALSSDPVLRIESQVSLALSELVANRYTASLTWIHSALESLPQVTAARAFAEVSAPMMATMLLLTGCTEDAQQLIDLVGPVISVVPSHLAIVSLLRGVSETNVELALGHLHAAAAERSATPMLRGQAELCIGLLLARAGRVDEVSPYMESAVATFRRIGAPGLAVITERELGPAGTAAGPVTQVLLAPESPESPESPEGTDHLSSSMVQGEKTWVISLLGGFTIESEGQKISLPQSVAAQAIKYLAVRKTVTVDELVDVLWTDIDPAVGGRRLRNILWRIKSVCGELVSRDGNLIRLSEFARSDLSEFETLATLALSSECPHDDAVQYAEEAVSHYRGQLLPGDLYIDWTGSYRESLTLLYVRVLDILLARSLDEGHVSNALGVLQRMIEAEPFEESYYLQAAELYSQSGRTNRARSTLERASRMLNELGISSCPALTQARQRLGLN
jgi:DNA-binding SARP family transcriptional activator